MCILQGLTALHYAIKSKHWDLARLLLDFDNLNANSKDHLLGRTPLHVMIASIHSDLIGKYLLFFYKATTLDPGGIRSHDK
jgi:ankyrin repeat protein